MYIKTKQTIIRNFNILDHKDYLKNIGSNENVGKYMLYKYIFTEQEAIEVINYFIKEDIFGNFHNYAITKNDQLIGTIGIIINNKHENCELTYNLSHEYWNKGIMTEVIKEIKKYIFNELKLNSIYIETMVINEPCNKLLRKCGFKHDGTIRQKYKDRFGNYQDINIYTSLRNDDYEKEEYYDKYNT